MRKFTFKQMRTMNDMTVKQIADKIGISAHKIERWEKDISALKKADFGEILKLCKAYKFSVDELKI